jgi:D-tyrosyl-tRNA(Tyr) deacylase
MPCGITIRRQNHRGSRLTWPIRDSACHLQPGAITEKLDAMRAVVQRVSRAQVTVNGEIVGQIGRGLLVLLGVAATDAESDTDYLADKISGLRIFEDASGKMNLAASEVGGAVLAVSQFTLYGDVRRGKRPSFDASAPAPRARQLYEYFVERIRATGLPCQTGKFQETMQVELLNDGPVTILLDSAKLF